MRASASTRSVTSDWIPMYSRTTPPASRTGDSDTSLKKARPSAR